MQKNIDNKRILKNTFALYFRQIITMCISLYTSRIVLRELGVTDFGINAVVGGLITICTFINGSIIQMLNRFFSFELGKQDYQKLNKIFSISLIIYIGLSIIFIILAETIGLWFLLNKMVIPPERLNAALWVCQFSILGTILGLINTPYISIVISREKFKVFAYMSIFNAVMKLAVVYSLVVIDFDKLKLLSILNFGVGCLTFIIYQRYCRSNFTETKFVFYKDKYIYKNMLKFSGWMLLNPISYTAKYQGIPMVFNLFFGPAINAATGIANRVVETIASFSENASAAVNPQIIKLYATGSFTEMWNLVIRATKMYYLLFFVIALPVIINAEFILTLWLGNVPDYAVIFTQLILIEQIIRTLVLASVQVNNASGNIKLVQFVWNIIQVSNLPIAIILCYFNFDIIYVFVAGIAILIVGIFFTTLTIKIRDNLPLFRFFKELYLPITIVTILSVTIPITMHYYLPKETLYSLLNITVCGVCGCVASYLFGLSKNERIKIIELVKKRIS